MVCMMSSQRPLSPQSLGLRPGVQVLHNQLPHVDLPTGQREKQKTRLRLSQLPKGLAKILGLVVAITFLLFLGPPVDRLE